jgi:uncharacterized Zn finger protein (UPF0148 family)
MSERICPDDGSPLVLTSEGVYLCAVCWKSFLSLPTRRRVAKDERRRETQEKSPFSEIDKKLTTLNGLLQEEIKNKKAQLETAQLTLAIWQDIQMQFRKRGEPSRGRRMNRE